MRDEERTSQYRSQKSRDDQNENSLIHRFLIAFCVLTLFRASRVVLDDLERLDFVASISAPLLVLADTDLLTLDVDFDLSKLVFEPLRLLSCKLMAPG